MIDNPISWFLLTIALLACIVYFVTEVINNREAHLSAAQEWRKLEDETRSRDYMEFYNYAEYEASKARRNRPLF